MTKSFLKLTKKGLKIDFANDPKNDFIPYIAYHREEVKLKQIKEIFY